MLFISNMGVRCAAMFVLLLAVISMLLHGVFVPEQTLFSNDGPLGRLMAECHQLPSRFTGSWEDLNSIGFNGGTASPSISFGLQFLLKPIWFSKLYALVSLVILGMGAWCFFMQLRLVPTACILGGLAAALNSCFFSVVCWGVAAHAITAGMNFFALAALADTSSRHHWPRMILAGLAVGMGVMEGADVGAIFSLYVAAFILYQAWIGCGSTAKKAVLGLSRVALIALCAVWIAMPAVSSLIGTSITGVAGTEQDANTKEARWDWATQWSLPIRESIGLVVPGLFGYRMDTPDGGCYWGEVGQDPDVAKYIANGRQGPPPQGLMRFSGGGFYAGILVAMLALWAAAQSLRSKDSIYTTSQRKWLWFWLVVSFVSISLAFGRFAPFYQYLYALPYFSTIRNPVKFIYLVSFAIIILFAYGIDGLWRKYVQTPGPGVAHAGNKLKLFWSNMGRSEKLWLVGCWSLLCISLIAWLQYNAERQTLVTYLRTVRFNNSDSEAIASFSVRQVGRFILYFILSASLIAAIFGGVFVGIRARWGAVAIGLLLFADLGRADLPWVIYWNYLEKYAGNPLIDRLSDKPYEHRVVILPGRPPEKYSFAEQALSRLRGCNISFLTIIFNRLTSWKCHAVPTDLAAYIDALDSTPDASGLQGLLRFWQLTNSRYVLGYPSALVPLNQID